MRKRARLVNLSVKNVSAVGSPANRRTWLMLKADEPKSYEERRRMVERAVRARWGSSSDLFATYLEDIWDGEAIVCRDGAYYAAAITFGPDGVELGDLRPVTRAWVEKRREARKAAWTTAYINDLPDSAFAVISPGGRKDDEGKTVPRSLRHLPYRNARGDIDLPHLRNALARLDQVDASEADKRRARARLQAAAREAGLGEEAEKAMTFGDAMMGRRLNQLYAALGEYYGALMETLDGIRTDDSETDKGGAMRRAVEAFAASIQEAMPRLLSALLVDGDDGEEDVAKIGRRISAQRLAKLRTLYSILGEIIAEGEGETTMMESTEKTTKPDASALQRLAALFGRLFGADEATVAELEKAATTTAPAPAQPDPATASALAELRKSNEELRARLEASEAAAREAAVKAQRLQEAEELRKFAEEISGFRDIGLDPAKDAAILRDVEAKVGKDAADRLREVFRANVAQKHAAGLMREVGATGAGNAPADSAAAEIEQRIQEAIAKSERLDRVAAMQQVFAADPALYERYRREHLVRI